jgi:polysaccharide pyruvyl transferase WcaK-like protein
MRILFDQVVFEQRNKGNVALLQTAVNRLNKFWPNATIEVLTDAPHLLKMYCPQAKPVSLYPWIDWSKKSSKSEKLHRLIPKTILRLLFELRDEIQYRWPEFTLGQVKSWLPTKAKRNAKLELEEPRATDNGQEYLIENSKSDLLQAIQGADLVVVTGGGFICDSEKPHILNVLNRLEIAIQNGTPTVMVGQGVGPIEDAELQARIQSVLPSVSLILIREQKIGRQLLESLGVKPERIIMTSDDAIEMAYEARTSEWGKGIGINLRFSHYTGVGNQYIEQIRPILHQAARSFDAPLISIPISQDIREADSAVIRQLMKGYDKNSISWRRYDTPQDLIKRVGRCRLVVTGAFHAAVFALAQGIPAIGLVKSNEYMIKFSGLKDEFGDGCQVIHLDDEQLQKKLSVAINSAWMSAESGRPQLLNAAKRQIELGQAGYQRVRELID